MQVSELKVDTLFLSNTVLTQYKPADILRNLNHYYDELVLEVWKAENSWKFDEGIDYLPIAVTKLLKGETDYQIPTDARKIEKIEIIRDNDTNKILTPIVSQDAPADSSDEGEPKYWYVKGKSIFVLPRASYEKDDGLIVHLSKSVTQLVEDTDEPKVEREFMRYLSVGAALDWYFAKGNTSKSREMERKLEKMKIAVRDFYNTRNEGYKSKFKPRRQNYK